MFQVHKNKSTVRGLCVLGMSLVTLLFANCSAPPQCLEGGDCGAYNACVGGVCQASLTFEGQVSPASSTTPTQKGEVVLFWMVPSKKKGYVFGSGTYQQGKFSGSVSRKLPDGAIDSPQSGGFGFAYVMVFPQGEGPKEGELSGNTPSESLEEVGRPLAAATKHLVVYKSGETLADQNFTTLLKEFPVGVSCAEVVSSASKSFDSLKPVDCKNITLTVPKDGKAPEMPELW